MNKTEVFIDGNSVQTMSIEEMCQEHKHYLIPHGMIKMDMQLTWTNGKQLITPVYMYEEHFKKLQQLGYIVDGTEG